MGTAWHRCNRPRSPSTSPSPWEPPSAAGSRPSLMPSGSANPRRSSLSDAGAALRGAAWRPCEPAGASDGAGGSTRRVGSPRTGLLTYSPSRTADTSPTGGHAGRRRRRVRCGAGESERRGRAARNSASGVVTEGRRRGGVPEP